MRLVPDMTLTLKKMTLTLKIGGGVHLPHYGHSAMAVLLGLGSSVDRDRKKSMFSEWPAEFSEYCRDKSKNFLLKKFLKILLPRHAH